MSRADIYKMGLVAYQIGLTPETVQEAILFGAKAEVRGVTSQDVDDLWRIKVRLRRELDTPPSTN